MERCRGEREKIFHLSFDISHFSFFIGEFVRLDRSEVGRRVAILVGSGLSVARFAGLIIVGRDPRVALAALASPWAKFCRRYAAPWKVRPTARINQTRINQVSLPLIAVC